MLTDITERDVPKGASLSSSSGEKKRFWNLAVNSLAARRRTRREGRQIGTRSLRCGMAGRISLFFAGQGAQQDSGGRKGVMLGSIVGFSEFEGSRPVWVMPGAGKMSLFLRKARWKRGGRKFPPCLFRDGKTTFKAVRERCFFHREKGRRAFRSSFFRGCVFGEPQARKGTTACPGAHSIRALIRHLGTGRLAG